MSFTQAELEKKLAELIDSHHVPGAQLAVLDGDTMTEVAATAAVAVNVKKTQRVRPRRNRELLDITADPPCLFGCFRGSFC